MVKQKNPLTTYAELARRLRVSTRTVENWRQYVDWPARGRSGAFNLRKIDEFCERHGLGAHNPSRAPAAKSRQREYIRAKICKVVEQAENERIKKERQLAEQAKELTEIVDASDVRTFCLRTKNVVTEAVGETTDKISKLLADRPADQDAWSATRSQILELAAGINVEIAAMMRQNFP